jgi:predicted ribosome quality control (RQC) complex YloA/Tae2 family protein
MGKYKHDGKKGKVLEALEAKEGSVKEACASVGVPLSTYYAWINNDATFKSEVEKLNNTILVSKNSKKSKNTENPEGEALKELLDRIVSMLREQGKYSGELEIQAELTARLIQRFNDIDQEMHSPDYDIVNVEYSREGNSRSSVNPLEKLYLEYYDRIHRALRALGMSVDAKERKSDNDGFLDKIDQFNSRYND